jgi:single-stranded DNA-binding protein
VFRPGTYAGKDPEKRHVRSNGANFTVLSIADTLHKGDHVLVDGQLVSSKYQWENGKSKKAKAAKVTVF